MYRESLWLDGNINTTIVEQFLRALNSKSLVYWIVEKNGRTDSHMTAVCSARRGSAIRMIYDTVSRSEYVLPFTKRMTADKVFGCNVDTHMVRTNVI